MCDSANYVKRPGPAPAIQRCRAQDKTPSNAQPEIQIRDAKLVVFLYQ